MQRQAKFQALLCGLLCALTLITPAQAAARPLDVSQISQAPLSLTEHLALLEDPSGQLTLSDVQSPAFAQQFKTDRPAGQALNFGYTQSAYWLRVELANSADRPITRMLEIAYARISDLKF
jgi:hypothetical protein